MIRLPAGSRPPSWAACDAVVEAGLADADDDKRAGFEQDSEGFLNQNGLGDVTSQDIQAEMPRSSRRRPATPAVPPRVGSPRSPAAATSSSRLPPPRPVATSRPAAG